MEFSRKQKALLCSTIQYCRNRLQNSVNRACGRVKALIKPVLGRPGCSSYTRKILHSCESKMHDSLRLNALFSASPGTPAMASRVQRQTGGTHGRKKECKEIRAISCRAGLSLSSASGWVF